MPRAVAPGKPLRGQTGGILCGAGHLNDGCFTSSCKCLRGDVL